MSAKDRLIKILREKKIIASTMPWTNKKAVCFTECPWSSLLVHAQSYSPFGLGFRKEYVYSMHGGPVYYIRPDHYKRQLEKGGFDEQVWPFITPFSPPYRPKYLKDEWGRDVDYTHEREWRVPHEFPFEYNNVQFVILPDYKVMAEFPPEFKDAIGRENFILLDNYKRIEEFWPVHIK